MKGLSFWKKKQEPTNLLSQYDEILEITNLQEAAKQNDLNSVRKILPGYKGERIPNIRDGDDRSALDYAILNKNFEMIEYIISMGANPNDKDSIGRSCLFFCCQLEDSNIFELLLNKGAQYQNLKDKDNNNLLHICAQYVSLSVAKRIFELMPKFNVNDKNNSDQTPLHFAQMNKNTEMIEYLMSMGAQVSDAPNKNTPLKKKKKKKKIPATNFNLSTNSNGILDDSIEIKNLREELSSFRSDSEKLINKLKKDNENLKKQITKQSNGVSNDMNGSSDINISDANEGKENEEEEEEDEVNEENEEIKPDNSKEMEKTELSTEIEKLKEQLRDSKFLNVKNNLKVEELEQIVSLKAQSVEKFKKLSEEKDQILKQKKIKSQKKKSEINKLQQELEDAKKRDQEKDKEKEKLKSESERNFSNFNEITTQYKQLLESQEKVRNNNEGEFKQYQSTIVMLNQQLRQQDVSYKETNTRNEKLINKLEQDITNLTKSADKLKQELSLRDEELDGSFKKIVSLQSEHKNYQKKQENFESALNENKKIKEEKETMLSELVILRLTKAQLSTEKKENEKLKEEVANLKKTIHQQENDKKKTLDDMENLKSTIKSLEESLEKSKNEFENISEKQRSEQEVINKKIIKNFKNQAKKLNESKEKLESRLNEEIFKIRILENENKTLSIENEKLQIEVINQETEENFGGENIKVYKEVVSQYFKNNLKLENELEELRQVFFNSIVITIKLSQTTNNLDCFELYELARKRRVPFSEWTDFIQEKLLIKN